MDIMYEIKEQKKGDNGEDRANTICIKNKLRTIVITRLKVSFSGTSSVKLFTGTIGMSGLDGAGRDRGRARGAWRVARWGYAQPVEGGLK